jgi:hypothetical protein
MIYYATALVKALNTLVLQLEHQYRYSSTKKADYHIATICYPCSAMQVVPGGTESLWWHRLTADGTADGTGDGSAAAASDDMSGSSAAAAAHASQQFFPNAAAGTSSGSQGMVRQASRPLPEPRPSKKLMLQSGEQDTASGGQDQLDAVAAAALPGPQLAVEGSSNIVVE